MKKSNNAKSITKKRLKRRRIIKGKRIFEEQQKRFLLKKKPKKIEMKPIISKKSKLKIIVKKVMQNIPIPVIIFLLIFWFLGWKIALIFAGIALFISLIIIIKFLYDINPRRGKYYKTESKNHGR